MAVHPRADLALAPCRAALPKWLAAELDRLSAAILQQLKSQRACVCQPNPQWVYSSITMNPGLVQFSDFNSHNPAEMANEMTRRWTLSTDDDTSLTRQNWESTQDHPLEFLQVGTLYKLPFRSEWQISYQCGWIALLITVLPAFMWAVVYKVDYQRI